MFLFLFALICHILKMANEHGVTLIPVYISTLPRVKAEYLLQGRLVPKWHLLNIAEAVFQLWHQPEVDLLASSCTNQCQHNYTFENLLPV